MRWYLKSCPACGGDLHDDLEELGSVSCFMCARTFNTQALHPEDTAEPAGRSHSRSRPASLAGTNATAPLQLDEARWRRARTSGAPGTRSA